MTSTLDGNIASQNKQRFPEYKKWSDASAINEFNSKKLVLNKNKTSNFNVSIYCMLQYRK